MTALTDRKLYYWKSETHQAEVDYLVQSKGRIVPVELKSGAAGAMNSLHQFMFDKKLDRAVRFDWNPPAVFDLSVKTTQGDPVSYRLCSFPLYYAEMLDTLLEAL